MSVEKSDKRFASTLARGLTILRIFRPVDDGLSNLEISQRSGIPRPTVSRLTYTLCALGYLTHGKRHDKYRLGPAALALGNIAAASFDFVHTATPIMQDLADSTGTLIAVAIQDDGGMLLAKTWRPAGSPPIWMDAGYRMPMDGSSCGKAFLGALSPKEFQTYLARQGDANPDQVDALHDLHATARKELGALGFAMTSGEGRYTQAIHAAAVPFRPSEFAEPVAFLTGGPASALSDAHIRDVVGAELVSAVAELQSRIEQTAT